MWLLHRVSSDQLQVVVWETALHDALNESVTACPSAKVEITIEATMPATRSAYSTAEAPRSSLLRLRAEKAVDK